MEDLQHYPAWKDALVNFDFTYGDIVELDWLYEAFGLERPHEKMPYKKASEVQLEFLTNFKKLEEHLLHEMQMALRNKRSIGYEVVTPQEQTFWAEQAATSEINKSIRGMYNRQINVNRDLLTAEQKKENSDALARTSMLTTMVGRFKKKQLTYD